MVHSAACRIKKAAVPNRVMAVPEKAVLGQIQGKSSRDHEAPVLNGSVSVVSAGEAKPVADISHQGHIIELDINTTPESKTESPSHSRHH